MKKYLVIGNPIEHSSSPLIHNYWMKKYNLVDCVYEKKKVEEKDLKDIVNQIRSDELTGANITVPLKKRLSLILLKQPIYIFFYYLSFQSFPLQSHFLNSLRYHP